MADGARSAGRKARDVADDGRVGVMTILPQARETAEQIAERVPEMVERARGSAFETKKTFDKMDDPTLREVAAGSLGLAAGLYVAGAPRLVVLAAATPGIFAAAAMATRRPAGRTRSSSNSGRARRRGSRASPAQRETRSNSSGSSVVRGESRGPLASTCLPRAA